MRITNMAINGFQIASGNDVQIVKDKKTRGIK